MEKNDSDNTPLTYALKPKVMDMKKLKTAVWTEINNSKSNEQKSAEDNIEIRKIPFNQIYESIPSKLSPLMNENLSRPLAFVALLHLANEHNLLIKNDVDSNDLNIYPQNADKKLDD